MKYRVTRKLGAGGMAELFLAVARGPEGFERRAVLKRIRPDLAASPTFVKMFIDEAALSARLTHPNIVHVYEFGSARGCHFMSMELIQGRDLRWMMARLPHRSAIPVPAVAAEIARQCCLALEYAHTLTDANGSALNIIHRDVTPSNVIVAYDGTVKLVDFGVARAIPEVRRSQTEAGQLKGKISYLAPEQLLGQKVDHRCDLFSLGVVLHEMLTWERLFNAPTDAEAIRRILDQPIVAPSVKWRTVPSALDRIVARALERDPERRYQSAAEMGDDLERYLTRSRYAGSSMRRMMRDRFTPIWRSQTPSEDDRTFVDPNREHSTLDAASCIVGEATVADAGMPPPSGWLRRWPIAAVASVVLIVSCLIGSVRRPRPSALPAAAPPVATVSISLDSWPQGALVYEDPDGSPIGETPLVLKLTRADERRSYTFRLAGYVPAQLQVIPDQDKPTLAQLRPAPMRLDRPRQATNDRQ
jgi:serine/threonine-protein kinase